MINGLWPFADSPGLELRQGSLESNPGIDAAATNMKLQRLGNCSLTTIGERPIFSLRKTTGPMLKGSTIILPLKFG
jgi:hypothetical protein